MAATLAAIPATHVTFLIAGTRAHVPDAENELWRLVGPCFLHLARWLLTHDGQRFRLTADDLVQLAFLKVRRSCFAKSGMRRSDLRRLVVRAMKQVLVDESRKSRLDPARLGRRLDRGPQLAQWELADLHDKMERLMRCNEMQWRIMELHIFEGLSHRQIAGVVRLSASQVRKEILATKRRLCAMDGDANTAG